MIVPTFDELAHVPSLQIYLRTDDYDEIEWAGLILARTPGLQHSDLELEAHNLYDDDEYSCDSAVIILQRCLNLASRSANVRNSSL
jgi:hypothetical protein